MCMLRWSSYYQLTLPGQGFDVSLKNRRGFVSIVTVVKENQEKRYPSDKEVYRRILRDIEKRGYGVLMCYGGNPREWDSNDATVYLTGEFNKMFLLSISPKADPYLFLLDPEEYTEDMSLPDYTPEHMEDIRRQAYEGYPERKAHYESAIQSGKFITLDLNYVGRKEIVENIKTHIPRLYPELKGKELFLIYGDEIGAGEYFEEIDQETQEMHGKTLEEFLAEKEPIVF